MRKAIFLSFLLLLLYNAVSAQVVASRNNYTGAWDQRAGWMQNWAGIQTTQPLPAATINQYGYLVRGSVNSPADMLLSGSASRLTVYDTLRIHGNLAVMNYASLVVETEGVLIVHGNYDQYDWGRLSIKGKMVVLGEFKMVGNTGTSDNTGKLYVGSGGSSGGWTMNVQTLANMQSENAPLAFFAYTNITARHCAGTNSGTLYLSGAATSVVRWESSTDNFRSNVVQINNTTAQHTYANLLRTTSFRVYYQKEPGVFTYSNGATVLIDEPTKAGTISGPAEVCNPTATVNLTLAAHAGAVQRWEWSTDNFSTPAQVLTTNNETFGLTNVTATTYVRAVVKSAGCSESTTPIFVLKVSLVAQGGTLQGPVSVCVGTNSGTLSLQNRVGNVVRWEVSTDNFLTNSQPIANTTDAFTFSNLTANSWYRVLVNNNGCSQAYSPSFQVSVKAPAAGTVSGPAAVCTSNNTGTLQLQNYTGSIVRWEISNNGFGSDVRSIAHTAATYTFSNLTATTWFRAVLSNTECGESHSQAWQVQLNEPSVGGTLAGAATVCASENSGTLALSGHGGTILRWEFSEDNFATDIRALAITATSHTYSNLKASTSYRAVVQRGNCDIAYSNIQTIGVSLASQAGEAAGSTTVCYAGNAGSVVLQSLVGEVLRWESSRDGFATITEHAITSSEFTYQNLTTTTSFRAVVKNGSCPEVISGVATITVLPAAVGGSVTADQVVISDVNAGTLQLTGYSGNIVQWESSTDNFTTQVSIIVNTSTQQSFENLSNTTWYRVKIQQQTCAPVYSLPAKVTVNHAPIAVDDQYLVEQANFTADISVLQNDSDVDGNSLQVVPQQTITTLAGGSVQIGADGFFSYTPPANYLGEDSFTYTVCDQVAGATLCDEATITLDVRLPAPAITVYQGVSPNGDMDNEYWQIDFIERYPANVVQLYDRYGSLVYEQLNYNNGENSFRGLANKGVRPGGDVLPDGTYYYKIITAPAAPVLKGYIVLKR